MSVPNYQGSAGVLVTMLVNFAIWLNEMQIVWDYEARKFQKQSKWTERGFCQGMIKLAKEFVSKIDDALEAAHTQAGKKFDPATIRVQRSRTVILKELGGITLLTKEERQAARGTPTAHGQAAVAQAGVTDQAVEMLMKQNAAIMAKLGMTEAPPPESAPELTTVVPF